MHRGSLNKVKLIKQKKKICVNGLITCKLLNFAFQLSQAVCLLNYWCDFKQSWIFRQGLKTDGLWYLFHYNFPKFSEICSFVSKASSAFDFQLQQGKKKPIFLKTVEVPYTRGDGRNEMASDKEKKNQQKTALLYQKLFIEKKGKELPR